MPPRASADRRARALCWGNDERQLVDSYYRRGPTHERGLDPSRMASVPYIWDIRDMEPLWQRHPQRNFNQNCRRRVAELEAERAHPGRAARFNNQEEEEEDVDDDDQEEDVPPQAAEPPRRRRECCFVVGTCVCCFFVHTCVCAPCV